MIRGQLFIMVILSFFSICVLADQSNTSSAAKLELDPETGLKIAPGWDVVKANCTVCHSARFIILQQGSRDTWLDMIRWMQKTQGLWTFDEKTEQIILDYLASQYPPVAKGRRSNLPANAMPPNPWPLH